MMVRFRVARHSVIRGVEIVEIWQGEDLIAEITPAENGVKVISKHAMQVRGDESIAAAKVVQVNFELE